MNGWQIRGGVLPLHTPCVMGILNVTPDSFSDGGQFNTPVRAAAHACEMAEAGAAIIDIGAQSTRPGATLLSAEEEWARLAPCLEAVLHAVDTPISVDTFYPTVAANALAMGAHIINDVSGSEHNGMLDVATAHGAGIVCMRTGDTRSRTASPDQTVADMHAYIRRVLGIGLPQERICFDVGIGFGSSTEGDLALIAQLPAFAEYGCPLLVGASRKRVVRDVCEDLLIGSVALHTAAMMNGAHIVRAHDVAETVAAARAVAAIKRSV